jgi:hypothetical protein
LYLESGAGSTLLKWGLIIALVNICLKFCIGILLWKIAMESKLTKSSVKYTEEQIGAGDPNLFREQNDRDGGENYN